MTIYDMKGAAARVDRDERTLKRWVARGWLTFTLGRVREADLLQAEKMARENMRRGGRKKGQGMEKETDLSDESLWPDGAVADGKVYSLELTRMMRFDADLGARWFAGEDVEPWAPCEPDLVEPPFEIESMTGTYAEVGKRAALLNARLTRNGIKAFLYFPHPLDPQGAR